MPVCSMHVPGYCNTWFMLTRILHIVLYHLVLTDMSATCWFKISLNQYADMLACMFHSSISLDFYRQFGENTV